jgi:hypothetical protein
MRLWGRAHVRPRHPRTANLCSASGAGAGQADGGWVGFASAARAAPPPTTSRSPVLKSFRLLSLIEGLSLITLLLIAMPVRATLGVDFVWPVGMVHGLLWLAYVLMSLSQL